MVAATEIDETGEDTRESILKEVYDEFEEANPNNVYAKADLEKVKEFYPSHSDKYYSFLDVSNPEELRTALLWYGNQLGDYEFKGKELETYKTYLSGGSLKDTEYTLGDLVCVCKSCGDEVPTYEAEYIDEAIDPEQNDNHCNYCAGDIQCFRDYDEDEIKDILKDWIVDKTDLDEGDAIEKVDELEEENPEMEELRDAVLAWIKDNRSSTDS